jgi:hypothetical protein
MAHLKRSIALALAAAAVIVGIALASEVTLNRSEPHCRYWSDVAVFGCAEHGDPSRPLLIPTVRPQR